LIHVSSGGSVGEADWTLQVASVGYVDDGEHCMRLMLWTDAAVKGAVLFCLGAGISKALAVIPEFFGSLVLFIIRPVNVLKLSVFRALLLDVDFVVLFKYGSV